MWISKHRLDRIENELRRLDYAVTQLQIDGYVRSDIGGDNWNWSDPRSSVPLKSVVFAIAEKLGIKISVDYYKNAQTRIMTNADRETGDD